MSAKCKRIKTNVGNAILAVSDRYLLQIGLSFRRRGLRLNWGLDSSLNPGVTEQTRIHRRDIWGCLVLAVVTLVLYLPALRHDFVQYDDQQYVTENPQVQAGLSVTGLQWAFGFHAGNWHPLAWLSHMLDCQLYGANPAGHHLTSILLHTANAVLLLLALRRLTGATWRSAIVAALFAWHPLHVESVAWVAERKDVLCALFWLLTLHAYAGYAARPGARRYAATLGFFVLALMAKPMAVTLPFVLLLLDYWPLKRVQNKSLRALFWEKTPFFAATLGVCVLTMLAQEQAIASTAGLTVLQRLANVVVAYAHYLGAMFVPQNLAVFYPYQLFRPASTIWLACLVIAAVSLLAMFNARRRPYLLIGWLWYLGTLVPVIGLVQVGDQAWADRYTYLPLIGLFVFVVWGAAEWIGNRPRLRVVAVAVMAIVLLATTSVQLRHWKNTRTLFEHADRVTHENQMAATILGSLLAQEGRLDDAIEHFQRALRYKPGYPEAHFFLGHTFDQQGKLEEAVVEYQSALRFKPMQEQTHIFLAITLAKQKKLEDAINHYLAALKLNPQSAVTHNNLARIYHTLGQFDAAVEHYTSALRVNPTLAIAHNNLGILLLQKGNLAEGARHLREALRLKPENPETEFNLALALNQQQQWSEAAGLFKKNMVGQSNNPKAHYEFAVALTHLKKNREAMSEYAATLLIQPDFPDALDGLAWILSTDTNAAFRNGTEAIPMAERACALTGRNDPVKLRTLAAAFAETSRFEEAINTVREAKAVAVKAKQHEVANECDRMLEHFQRGERWRQ